LIMCQLSSPARYSFTHRAWERWYALQQLESEKSCWKMLDGDFLGEHALAVTYLRLKEHMPAPRDLGRTGTPCFHFNYASKPTLSKYSSLALLVFACNDKYMMLRYNIIQRYIYIIYIIIHYIYICNTYSECVSHCLIFPRPVDAMGHRSYQHFAVKFPRFYTWLCLEMGYARNGTFENGDDIKIIKWWSSWLTWRSDFYSIPLAFAMF
jgi:hypothetical protein